MYSTTSPRDGVRAHAPAFAKTAAPFITCAQIAQMAVGSAVTARSGFLKARDQTCQVDPANVKLGLAMYGAYKRSSDAVLGRT